MHWGKCKKEKKNEKQKKPKDKNIIIIIALNESKNYGTGWHTYIHTYIHMYDMCLQVQVILVTPNLSVVGEQRMTD